MARISPSFRSAFLACLISLFLSLVFLHRVVLFGESPLLSSGAQIYDPAPSIIAFGPYSEIEAKILKQNHSFLWTSGREFGAPIQFTFYHGAFLHPWTWLRSFIPFDIRWSASAFGLIFFACLGHLLIARQVFRWNWLASACFAELGVTNLCFLRQLNHHAILVYASALFAVFGFFLSLTLERFSKRDILKIFILETAGGTLAFLGGFPEEFFPLLVVGLFCVFYAFLFYPFKRVLKILGILVAAGAVSVCLSAYSLLGILEGLWLTGGTTFRGSRGQDFLSLRDLSMLFIRFDDGRGMRVFYGFGAVVSLLVVIALFSGSYKKTHRVLKWSLFTSGLFFMTHLFGFFGPIDRWIGELWLFRISNFWGFFPPLLILSGAWLASSAVQSMTSDKEFWRNLSRTQVKNILLVYLGLLCFCILSWTLWPPAESFIARKAVRLIPAFLLFLGFFFVWKKSHKLNEVSKRGVSVLILLFLFGNIAELFMIMHGFKYLGREEVRGLMFGADQSEVKKWVCVPSERDNYRIWLTNGRIMEEFCTGVPDSSDELPLPRNQTLKSVLFDRQLIIMKPQFSYSLEATSIRWVWGLPHEIEVLKSFKIPYLMVRQFNSGYQLVKILDTLPRAYLTTQCRAFDLPHESVAVMASGAYRLGEALIESDRLEMKNHCKRWSEISNKTSESSDDFVKRVSIIEDTGAKITLEEVSGPGMFVLNDSIYPGWRVFDRLSQQELSILPTNIAFKGVPLLEKRKYSLEFVYSPIWVPYARILTIVGLISLLTSVLGYFYFRKKEN